ncbi:anthranilate synthase component I [Pseudalkalibacillus caeni]|uniref:Anthranilate synthase component 1 n=2 Tax=Exobacillus caeni TaxID=2574798 RepID=A0A5R9F887_9BACL|nr:anthranilate synthase component I [Pseudalkalibacillus caeni]TLS35945.1 anthranilate synthase component I [Pseudalkalibacillus caeni]
MATNFGSFLKDASTYRTIPITRTFLLDTVTPIQIFQNLKKRAAYLLESNDKESLWSRYSFIGLDPYLTLKEESGTFLVENKSAETITRSTTFKDAVNSLFGYLNAKKMDLPFPFYGGAVGYIGYEGITHFEPVTPHDNHDLLFQDFYFTVCETILIFDHHSRELTICYHASVPEEADETTVKNIYNEAIREIDRTVNQAVSSINLDGTLTLSGHTEQDDFEGVKSNYEKEKFFDHVEKIKEYIKAGDVFQAVLSQRFELDINVSALELYRILRIVNPSPYMFYLRTENAEVVGSSPERLVQVLNREVEIHPIAGTRKRGSTPREDKALETELLADEKERAEHYMLVDLARNDVGRVAEYGTVRTPVLMDIARFSHVMHIISKVRGNLAEEYEPIDALISSFPAGTVSGAPKIRAMEILRDLEPNGRGVYSGAMGYIGFDGNIDSCIAIRTMVVKDKKAYIQAGAGVVADSIPEQEWEETRNKARALIKAVKMAEQIFKKEAKEYV